VARAAKGLIHFRDQATGNLLPPFADGRHAPIAAEDQGRLIAAILEDPAPHAGKIYPLFGPVELDHHQIATAMSVERNKDAFDGFPNWNER
jgi:uncharacterized protein YbjT (DUF2867 family)